jgi:RNA polymerase sigma factor (sigma-70 family)
MSSESSQVAAQPAFVTTRWTQVLAARGESPEARVALADLCQAYWLPVYRFIRRNNHQEDAARDLTQEFFAQLLAQQGFVHLEPGRGRFRSYLLGAVKHFLADQQDRANAAKRGGACASASLEAANGGQTTTSLQIPDPGTPIPDAYFDRQWALNVIELALNALAAEFETAGKGAQYNLLKPWLVGEVKSLSQGDAARELGLTEGAVKVAIHRLRKRFRELVKSEIAGTVDHAATVQAELNYLLEALAQS